MTCCFLMLVCRKWTAMNHMIKKIDSKIKVCFMSAIYMYYEALREVFPFVEIECFIQKPVKIKDL